MLEERCSKRSNRMQREGLLTRHTRRKSRVVTDPADFARFCHTVERCEIVVQKTKCRSQTTHTSNTNTHLRLFCRSFLLLRSYKWCWGSGMIGYRRISWHTARLMNAVSSISSRERKKHERKHYIFSPITVRFSFCCPRVWSIPSEALPHPHSFLIMMSLQTRCTTCQHRVFNDIQIITEILLRSWTKGRADRGPSIPLYPGVYIWLFCTHTVIPHVYALSHMPKRDKVDLKVLNFHKNHVATDRGWRHRPTRDCSPQTIKNFLEKHKPQIRLRTLFPSVLGGV